MSTPRPASGVDLLRARFADGFFESGPVFDEARSQFNARYGQRPIAVVRCLTESDVVTAVRTTREAGLRLTVRVGGHAFNGACVAEGAVLLDLRAMNRVEIDAGARTARIGGGALSRHVSAAVEPHGLVAVLGGCDGVGVAGFTLGGGIGPLSRSLGLGADNLRSARLVTADGQCLFVDRNHHPDLFWALRGAGAQFGIVTSLEVDLHPVESAMLGGALAWPIVRAPDIHAAFQRHFVEASDPRLGLVLAFAPGPPEDTINLFGMFNGRAEDANRAFAPFRALKPAIDLVSCRTYQEHVQFYSAALPVGACADPHGGFLRELGADTIQRLARAYTERPVSNTIIEIEVLGGVIASVPTTLTAFPHRHQSFCGKWIPHWKLGDDATETAGRKWSEEIDRLLASEMDDRAVYVNYPEPEGVLSPWIYYGENYERLVEIKRRYDPESFFSTGHRIGSASRS